MTLREFDHVGNRREKKNHSLVIQDVHNIVLKNVFRTTNGLYIYMTFFALPRVVLKWIYYFSIIVTPFQFKYITIPTILC